MRDKLPYEQSQWLGLLIEHRPDDEPLHIPGDVLSALVERNLVHFRDGEVEITFDGIRAIRKDERKTGS